MAKLHITNLTGKPLSLSCSSGWMSIEHDERTVLSKLPGISSFELGAFQAAFSNEEKRTSLGKSFDSSPWLLDVQPPRLRNRGSWHVVRPRCQHKRCYCVRSSSKSCKVCSTTSPWTVYSLQTQTESHLVFLRARDMSSFLSELGNEIPLSDLVLPGTHDSLAFYGWPVSQCQSPNQPLSKQLSSGIRALDVRLSVVDGVLMAYHGAAPQRTSFSAILHTLYHFLQERSSECVVVSLKQEDFAKTSWRVFSRCVREELERGSGGIGMWWLENRIPRLGEVRGKCVMLSRFGGQGEGWEHGLEGMGIHPTEWPDSAKEGFEWDLKGTTVRTHDWYAIPSLLALPEKAALCIQNLVLPLTDRPTLGITFLSAAGGALSLPPFCALGFGWPSWGLGVEGMNSRVGKWLLGQLTSSYLNVDKQKARWSVQSDKSDTKLLGIQTENEPKRPVRGWVFIDYFAEPDEGLVQLLVENNFIGR